MGTSHPKITYLNRKKNIILSRFLLFSICYLKLGAMGERDYDPQLSEVMVGRGQKHSVQGDGNKRDFRNNKVGWRDTCLKCTPGNHQEELELHGQSPNSITGITERQWENLRSWSAAVDGCKLNRKHRQRMRRTGLPFVVKGQLEHIDLFYRMDDTLAEFGRIGGGANGGDIVV